MRARHKVAALMLGFAVLAASALVVRRDPPTPDRLTSLRDGMSTADADAVRRAAHGFQSSSAALGAATLAVLSGDFEAAARHAHHVLPTPRSIEAEHARVHDGPPPKIDRNP